jgi:hypothetical protein
LSALADCPSAEIQKVCSGVSVMPSADADTSQNQTLSKSLISLSIPFGMHLVLRDVLPKRVSGETI